MAKVIILGSGYAIPDEEHENTHLVVTGKDHTVMVDCVGSPIPRLHHANVDISRLTDLILTHFHPDHISGVPTLLMDMWLMGRHDPLAIHGLDHTLDRIEKLMGFYEWDSWPNFFPVVFHHLPAEEMAEVLDSAELRIFSSPVKHWIPTIGLRFEFKEPERVLAYSCDTEPCSQVVKLAAHANILIHEATGLSEGHSSAGQAGKIGQQAGAKSLYLIHYPTGGFNPEPLVGEAQANFSGPVKIARDYMALEI